MCWILQCHLFKKTHVCRDPQPANKSAEKPGTEWESRASTVSCISIEKWKCCHCVVFDCVPCAIAAHSFCHIWHIVSIFSLSLSLAHGTFPSYSFIYLFSCSSFVVRLARDISCCACQPATEYCTDTNMCVQHQHAEQIRHSTDRCVACVVDALRTYSSEYKNTFDAWLCACTGLAESVKMIRLSATRREHYDFFERTPHHGGGRRSSEKTSVKRMCGCVFRCMQSEWCDASILNNEIFTDDGVQCAPHSLRCLCASSSERGSARAKE